jgi:hypothetical protein
MAAFFGGCASLTGAAIAGAFEARLAPALVAAAPWLLLAVLMWAGVVWPDLRGRRRHGGLVALAVGAMWVAAVSLTAGGVVAFLGGVTIASFGSRLILRPPSGGGSAATMDAQT